VGKVRDRGAKGRFGPAQCKRENKIEARHFRSGGKKLGDEFPLKDGSRGEKAAVMEGSGEKRSEGEAGSCWSSKRRKFKSRTLGRRMEILRGGRERSITSSDQYGKKNEGTSGMGEQAGGGNPHAKGIGPRMKLLLLSNFEKEGGIGDHTNNPTSTIRSKWAPGGPSKGERERKGGKRDIGSGRDN